jgi:putative DNA primase/helicase
MLGDYAAIAEPDLLLQTGTERHPTGVADLFGKRFVTCSETEDGKKLAEGLFKRLTGDRTIKARRMHENFFTFPRTFKVFLATNKKPEVKGQDYATWRRIRLVPFNATFVKAGEPINPPAVRREDPTLGAALLQELPGILNLMVEACLDWQRNGLRPPKAVVAATEDYRQSMDHLPEFIAEACIQDKKGRVATDILYTMYTKWCRNSNYEPMSKRTFGGNINRMGYELVPSNGRHYRSGLKLRTTIEG